MCQFNRSSQTLLNLITAQRSLSKILESIAESENSAVSEEKSGNKRKGKRKLEANETGASQKELKEQIRLEKKRAREMAKVCESCMQIFSIVWFLCVMSIGTKRSRKEETEGIKTGKCAPECFERHST